MRSITLALIVVSSTLFMLGACTQTDEERDPIDPGLATATPGLVVEGPVSTLGLFELEGNAVDEAVDGDDWDTLYGGGGSAFEFTFVEDEPRASIFTTGGSKDIHDVTDWRWTDGSVPDKDDLLNAFAAAYTCPEGKDDCDPGDLIIYFGSDRYANNGDANIAFWFFQDDVGTNPDGTFAGEHREGDLLIVIKYPQGSNAVPLVLAYEWVNSGGDASDHLLVKFNSDEAECGMPGEKTVCAITNAGVEDAIWTYVPKFGEAQQYPHESLYEGGVNVTDLFGFTPCFNSFLAESRSSESVTSQLKDFVLGKFELCSLDLEKDCDVDFNSSGDSLIVTFYGTLTNTSSIALKFELSDNMYDIEKVCFDNNTNGSCDTTDPTPSDLVINGVATFTLEPGETVLYTGEYTDTSPTVNPETGEFEYEDTVTALGWEVGVDPEITPPVLTETEAAQCSREGIPSITIEKDCESTINSAGTAINVTVSGGGWNDGDVKLVSVKLEDVPALDSLRACLDESPYDHLCDSGETILCSDYASCSGTGFELLAGQHYAFEGAYTTATDPSAISDTMTVTGHSVFNSESGVEESDVAACPFESLLPGITVTKDCEVVLNATVVPGNVVLETMVSGTVTNTGNVQLTDVALVDSDATIVLSATTLSPYGTAGDSATYTGTYFPDSVPAPGSSCAADYTDTVSASGTGALGTGLIVADTDGTPAQSQAWCSLCPDTCE